MARCEIEVYEDHGTVRITLRAFEVERVSPKIEIVSHMKPEQAYHLARALSSSARDAEAAMQGLPELNVGDRRG